LGFGPLIGCDINEAPWAKRRYEV